MRAEARLERPASSHGFAVGLPQVIEPMQPTAAPEPFDSPAHVYEVRWDGVRAIAFRDGNAVRLQDRWGRDITHRFPELGGLAGQLRTDGMALDGEVVCLDEDGHPDFGRLTPRLGVENASKAAELAHSAPVTFQAFDILYRDGQFLGGWPLRRRKEMLLSLVRAGGSIAIPDWVEREGIAFFEAARDHQLRGIIAKEMDSTYAVGERRGSWLSVPVYEKDQLVVGGYVYGGRWTPGRGNRRSSPPDVRLLVGRFVRDGQLALEAEAPIGLAGSAREALLERLDEATQPQCPFRTEPQTSGLVSWCRPELVVSVRHAGSDQNGRLRFPILEALRPDVPASSCTTKEHALVR